MNTVMSSKGQIIIPAKFRRQDKIAAGQAFDVERVDKGKYRHDSDDSPEKSGIGGRAARLSGERLVRAD